MINPTTRIALMLLALAVVLLAVALLLMQPLASVGAASPARPIPTSRPVIGGCKTGESRKTVQGKVIYCAGGIWYMLNDDTRPNDHTRRVSVQAVP